MSATPLTYAEVEVGTELPSQTVTIQRWNLIQYAGASGDFNIIHWNERIATMVGLPDVIAHGMYTMAQAARVVTDWAGDPAAMVDVQVRFSRPVVVPDDDVGATVVIAGRVEEMLDGNLVVVGLTAECDGQGVLSGARATVRLR